ncbi:hypothetical protein LOTGIDRAFT_168592 [Lottia gigantea]|uniref:Uncharacterized protein n=1 Tax=Lottia gigantea TaxID=225164 RepID=V4B7F5_LOTGI|nr:hypothetical protein LOTGIDRAFT_168592 [Lottia gigantea]ESO84524.1 hypothetical protein LOTGIDRAFT_168592 [Lottia gigantea]
MYVSCQMHTLVCFDPVKRCGEMNASHRCTGPRTASATEMRSKTAPQRKVWLSRAEIQRALPRKSFFSCHDNKLRKARFESGEFAAFSTKSNPLVPGLSNVMPSRSAKASLRSVAADETDGTGSAVKTTSSQNVSKESITGDSKTENMKPNWVESVKNKAISRIKNENLDALGQSHSNLLHENSELFLHDCKPLFEYLKFVKNNKDEWLVTYGSVPPSSQNQHIFASAAAKSTESYLVTASYEVGARRSFLVDSRHHPEVTHDKNRKSHQEDKKNLKTQDGNEVDEMSEIDRLRLKAKLWAESVSTSTLIRCRIKCLQALGEDDTSLTTWWTSLQTCTYLR